VTRGRVATPADRCLCPCMGEGKPYAARTVQVGGVAVRLVFAPGGADLVLCMCGGDPARILTEAEAATWRGLRFEKRRSDWIAGRCAAKAVLADFLGGSVAPGEVEVIPEESRRPVAYMAGGGRIHASLSISHRGGAAAAAVVDERLGRVGVDVEVMEERSAALAEDAFTTGERAMLGRLGRWGIATVWSVKEAGLKAAGVGLGVPLDDAEVVELEGGKGRVAIRGFGDGAVVLIEEEPFIVALAVVPSALP